MSYEPKDNSGVLFINDRKDKDSHPDRTGTALIDGREYWVSGWLKKGKRGPFLSLSFKRKDGRNAPQPVADARPAASYAEELDDEVPF